MPTAVTAAATTTTKTSKLNQMNASGTQRSRSQQELLAGGKGTRAAQRSGIQWEGDFFIVCLLRSVIYLYVYYMSVPLRERTVTAKVQLTQIRQQAAARLWLSGAALKNN